MVSPLRPVRPRQCFPAAPSQKEIPPNKGANSVPDSGREIVREAPGPSVFARDEYHSAIRGLGSAKSRLQGLSQPQFSSTPAVPSSNKSALVPEEEYVADDWLEDDLEEIQPKKKRRLRAEQNGIRGEDVALPSAARGQNRHLNSDTACRGRDLICILFYSTLLCSFYLHYALFLLCAPQSFPPPTGVSLLKRTAL